jgi:hypothetical protein
MTFLQPLFFSLALGVAAGIVALHFIVTRQPAQSVLPTVRFVPVSAVRVPTIARRPEHLLLLLLRVLLVLLVGAAFARPVLTGAGRPVARVILADVSRHVGDLESVRDSARALLEHGDVLVVFDSAARVVRGGADSIVRPEGSRAPGRLSPALIRALRAASELRSSADSLELAVVSPLEPGEWDAATDSIRALWPGRVRLMRVPAAADSTGWGSGLAVVADRDDPVAVAASLAGRSGADTAVRLVRGDATAADSLWAAAGRRALVRWPLSAAPPGWEARGAGDTVGAVTAGSATVVFPLERRWKLAGGPNARVVAHWVDGEPAASEREIGAGCIRDIAIAVPVRGDLVLRPAFARLLDALTAPCGEAGRGPARAMPDVGDFAGSGPLASRASILPPATVVPPLVPWLLAGALLLAVGELFVRRRATPA